MNIFLVEDDSSLNKILTDALEQLGYNTLSFTDGKQAFDNINKHADVYLIDINIPSLNGLELIKQIKLLNSKAKIFIISGDTNIETILRAYKLGCDDYIKKPFDIREIVAKIKNRLTKSFELIPLSGCCVYDPVGQFIIYKNNELQLTKKETTLLNILMKNIGNTVANDEIEYNVWGEIVGNGYTRQLISKLRRKLPCDIIKNHAAMGYRIERYVNS